MPPTSGAAQLFIDQNYGGASSTLDEGRYDVERLSAKDAVGNDTVSSIKVADGYAVTVYTNADFSGTSKTFTADTAYVGDDLNDKISSVMVSPSTSLGIDSGTLQGSRLRSMTAHFHLEQGFLSDEGLGR